jgi:hypothetical protein
MASQARSAYGTIFKIGNDEIPEVVSIEGLGSRADTVDTSAMDGSGYSSEVTTIKRNNPITLTVNYIPGNSIQDSLKAQYDAGSLTAYSVTVSGSPSASWNFDARVSQWQLNPLGVNTAQQLAVVFNPNGPILISGA